MSTKSFFFFPQKEVNTFKLMCQNGVTYSHIPTSDTSSGGWSRPASYLQGESRCPEPTTSLPLRQASCSGGASGAPVQTT